MQHEMNSLCQNVYNTCDQLLWSWKNYQEYRNIKDKLQQSTNSILKVCKKVVLDPQKVLYVGL